MSVHRAVLCLACLLALGATVWALTPAEITRYTTDLATGDEATQKAAITALVDAGVTTPVLDFALTDKDVPYPARAFAFDTLGDHLTPDMVPRLIVCLREDNPRYVLHYEVTRAFGHACYNPNAFPGAWAVVDALKQEAQQPRNILTIGILEILSNADLESRGIIAQNLLVTNREDRNIDSSEIEWAINHLPSSTPWAFYQAMYQDPRYKSSYLAFLYGMPRTNDPAAFDFFANMLDGLDNRGQYGAMHALHLIVDPRMGQFAIRRMCDQKNPVWMRHDFASIVASIASPDLIPRLVALSKDKEAVTRACAFEALAGYDDPRAVAAMEQALRNATGDELIKFVGSLAYAVSDDVGDMTDRLRRDKAISENCAIDIWVRRGDPQLQRICRGIMAKGDPLEDYWLIKALAWSTDHAKTTNYLMGQLSNYLQKPQMDDRDHLCIENCLYVQQYHDCPEVYSALLAAQATSGGPLDNSDKQMIRNCLEQITAIQFAKGKATAYVPTEGPLVCGLRPALLAPPRHESPIVHDPAIQVPPTDPAFGTFTQTIVSCFNASDRAVVILGIRPLGHDGTGELALFGSMRGTMVALPNDAGYRWQPGGTTPYTSAIGLVLPGQLLQVQFAYRPLFLVKERFAIDYVQAAQPYDGTAASLQPFQVYLPQANAQDRTRFALFQDAAWRQQSAGQERIKLPRWNSRTAFISGLPANTQTQFVIRTLKSTDDLLSARLNPTDKALSLTIPYVERMRALAAYITGLPGEKLSLAYSTALGGYVVNEPDGTYWLLNDVKQQQRGTLLPTVPPLLCQDIDLGGAQVKIQGMAQPYPAKLWGQFPLSAWNANLADGPWVSLDGTAFAPFLRELAKRGAGLTQQIDANGNRYYVAGKAEK